MRAWLLMFSLLLTPCVSGAGTIFVDFNLSASTLHFLGGLLVVPPDGSITGGTMTVAVPGTGLESPTAGPAEITDLTLTADFEKAQFGVTLTGTFGMSQQGAAAATLGADLSTLDLPLLGLGVTAHIECSGASCGLLGTFPIDQSDSRSFANTVLTLAALSATGVAGVFGTIQSAPGQPFVEISGKESGRSFVVPEPATGALALVGLAGLAATGRRARRVAR